MRVVNTRRKTITEYDLTTGYLEETKILKPDAIRLGKEITVEKNGKTVVEKKRRYTPEDFEIVMMYIPNPVETAEEKIVALKNQLANSDYKVIKCVESNLAGEELPYDINELHKERNAIREEINRLEANK